MIKKRGKCRNRLISRKDGKKEKDRLISRKDGKREE